MKYREGSAAIGSSSLTPLLAVCVMDHQIVSIMSSGEDPTEVFVSANFPVERRLTAKPQLSVLGSLAKTITEYAQRAAVYFFRHNLCDT